MSANATAEPGAIRDRRLGLGLTQQDVAVRAGCSMSYVRLLESGYKPESSEVLERIDAVLNDSSNDARPVGQPGAVTTSAGRGRHAGS